LGRFSFTIWWRSRTAEGFSSPWQFQLKKIIGYGMVALQPPLHYHSKHPPFRPLAYTFSHHSIHFLPGHPALFASPLTPYSLLYSPNFSKSQITFPLSKRRATISFQRFPYHLLLYCIPLPHIDVLFLTSPTLLNIAILSHITILFNAIFSSSRNFTRIKQLSFSYFHTTIS
jgi:hypothetical protein